jgi:outer membrane biosynthesis protein TonB
MSELTPPEPTLPELPRRSPWTVWGTIASAMLHVGVLAFLVLQPPPGRADAAPPQAINVELVPPPEAARASELPAEAPEPQEPQESAATAPSAKPASAEPPPAEPSTPPAAAEPPPETPSETAAPKSAPVAPTTQASEPARGSETPTDEVAPIPQTRPRVKGLTAPASVPEAVTAVTADTGATAEGTAPPVASAEPDVATLELGALHKADRFYLKSMLSASSMAQARAVLKTLPPEKRLAQTCNLEALAQIGNAGKGFSPDVVMAEAYARSEISGPRLAASGAIFRSGERWYGLAFDCTLSDDLTGVTAFSYRLGTDVTDAVLARLSKT